MKATKISGYLLLRDSSDPVVSNTYPNLKTGKWCVEDSVKVLDWLSEKLWACTNKVVQDWACLNPLLYHRKGTILTGNSFPTLEDMEKENDLAKATQLHLQGNGVRW